MRTKQNYVRFSPEVIEQARQIDLLTYLRTHEPDNLKRISGNVYATRDHDSLKISNGKWYWWSRGIGGGNALDYLIKVRKMHFVEAVQLLTGSSVMQYAAEKASEKPQKPKSKELYLPSKNADNNQILWYLTGRGIAENIILECIEHGILYESKDYHSAVFVGRDDTGKARFAAVRSTMGKPFKGDAFGSDKRFSFRMVSEAPSNTLHLFEASIDLLSYATYLQYTNHDYHSENLLSLAGVYQPAKDISQSKIPAALTEFLEKNPQVKTIYLHLDNDKAGRLSAKGLTEALEGKYEIVDAPPPIGKDINDFLLYFLRHQPQKSHRTERDVR